MGSFANQVFRTGREQIIETTFETPHGQHQYETRITSELGADGSVATVLSVARDITNQRRADLDRKALVQEVLERDARLQELVPRMLTERTRDVRRTMGSQPRAGGSAIEGDARLCIRLDHHLVRG